VKTFRFDTDKFPRNINIDFRLNNTSSEIWIHNNKCSFKTSEIRGVWFRKIWTSDILGDIDSDYVSGVRNEIRSSLLPFLIDLESLPRIGDLSIAKSIESDKIRQLKIASVNGLKIPNTLISNRIDSLHEFYEKNNGNIIAKLQKHLSFGMEANGLFFHTTTITQENINQFGDSLSVCPMVFQSNIEKVYELRVIYVDGVFFTGKIDCTKSKYGQTDWRASEINNIRWEKYSLPKSIKEKLKRFMEESGLNFGAIDLIKDSNGNYIFLEVNPSGEWGMLQKYLDFPIAQSIATSILSQMSQLA
jgi:hypothetical protein